MIYGLTAGVFVALFRRKDWGRKAGREMEGGKGRNDGYGRDIDEEGVMEKIHHSTVNSAALVLFHTS